MAMSDCKFQLTLRDYFLRTWSYQANRVSRIQIRVWLCEQTAELL